VIAVSSTSRLEFRVRPEVKARIERAAALDGVPVSDFVRALAETRADEVLAEHETQTRVPADFFDEVLAALDAPTRPRPSPALRRAAKRSRDVVSS
jgi:uncharacterized protein (DUF1778 family)